MNWEQKVQALQCIGEFSLNMRKPGDWYVSHRVEIRGGSLLESPATSGVTPQDVVEQYWEMLTNLKVGDAIVNGKKAWVWHGFMWREVER